jgi:hypothetical protein
MNQPSQAAPGNGAIMVLFHVGCSYRVAPKQGCSPSMRAERVKLKSCRDDKMIAQGK